MGQLKAFVVWVLKATVALVLAVVALGFLGWGGYAVWNSIEKTKHAPLAEPKTWPPIKDEALENVQLALTTMWRDDRLYYQFRVRGYPTAIAAVRDGPRTGTPSRDQFTISLLDENGFKLFEHAILLESMTKIVVDSGGRGAGLSANDDTSMGSDEYRRAARWDIAWSFREPPPSPAPPVAAPKLDLLKPSSDKAGVAKANWRNVSLWRTLQRGMSRDEIRQVLGEPTKIAESEFLILWYYGYPLGGSVEIDPRSGKVLSWTEP